MDNSEYCEYYTNYKGPNLISVLINNIENKELYLKICKFYGQNNNWNCNLYKSKDILNNIYLNQEIILNYAPTKSGIQNWTKYIYKNSDEIFNPPLFTPMSLL